MMRPDAWFVRRTAFLEQPHAGRWALLLVPLLLGLLSLLAGQDDGWDMRNYHLYNVHALLGGRIELGIVSTSLILSHVKSGALKGIAVVGPRRIPGLSDLPTMGEQGMGAMEIRSALPLFGPKGLPAPIVQRLNRAVAAALGDEETKRRLANAYIDATPMSAAQTGDELAREHAHLGKLIQQLGIKADGGS